MTFTSLTTMKYTIIGLFFLLAVLSIFVPQLLARFITRSRCEHDATKSCHAICNKCGKDLGPIGDIASDKRPSKVDSKKSRGFHMGFLTKKATQSELELLRADVASLDNQIIDIHREVKELKKEIEELKNDNILCADSYLSSSALTFGLSVGGGEKVKLKNVVSQLLKKLRFDLSVEPATTTKDTIVLTKIKNPKKINKISPTIE